MELEARECYRAIESRDARFDGRFFIGVLTTGVYCRPVCPARTPKFKNIKFFACAAGAQEAGFRPCRRCRPESSPGTPAWSGTSATVSRALRLIELGVADEEGIDGLATRLGVGTRHLRRLFDEHLGVSPMSVSQTRRLHFAKKLIDETSLPLTEIAFTSGFASLRRFNQVFRDAYGMPPRDVRKGTRAKTATASNARLRLKLSFRPPFSWTFFERFFALRALPGVESFRDGTYRRSVGFNGESGVLSVSPSKDASHLVLEVPPELSPHLPETVARVRRVFDLGADPQSIANHFSGDPTLAPILEKNPGLRVPGAWDPFETSVRTILGQQVSVKGATTVAGRLIKIYGEPLPGSQDEEVAYLFPTPERLSKARMHQIGVPRKRAGAVRALARAVADGSLDFHALAGLEQAKEQLCALPGIGPWTAEYIAMRALGEPDAFPAGDLGLRIAISNGRKPPVAERDLNEIAERWRPWRAYAATCLWSSLHQDGA